MTITVNFPNPLHAIAGKSLQVNEHVTNVGDLIAALDRLRPGLARELSDPLYNFAINDHILLHRALSAALKDGDIVEVIPTIAGGATD